MMSDEFATVVALTFGAGMLSGLIYFIYAAYLARKWLTSVEITMTGRSVYADNFIFSVHGIILFGSVFIWDWHARRQKDAVDDRDWFEARENVPLSVRRKFIFAYALFFFSGFLMFVPVGILWFFGEI